MRRNTAILWVLTLLAGVALNVGATGAAARSATGTTPDTVTPAEPQILQFGLSGSPDTLDPHGTSGTLTFQVIRSFYDTLVEPDQDGMIVPALATEWTISDDQLTWTFKLRSGVLFHNGDSLTSADVVATIDRLRSPELNSGKAAEFAAVNRILTPDEATVVFQLSEPSPALLSALASGWGAILPESLIEADHDFAHSPVGTGPFLLDEWVPDNRIVMTRNDDYWLSGYPLIDGVVVNVIPEPSVMVQGLLTGDLDAVESVTAQDLPTLRARPGIAIQTNLTTLVEVLAMNTARPPLDNVAIRQAVAQAIDKAAVMDIAYGGGEVVNTFMDYANPYYIEFDFNPYSPAAARAALVAAGYDASRPLIMKVPEVYAAHVTAAQMYQEMLKDVGMNVELQLVDWSTWLGEVYRGDRDYNFTVIGHTGKLDPAGRLGGYGAGTSYVQWQNQVAADAIERAGMTVDFSERRRLYGIALEEMSREVPQVYIGSNYRYLATRDNVKGLRQDTQLDTFDFRFVSMKE